MSRSYRKTPMCGIAVADSEKAWKKSWHSGFRAFAKHLFRLDPDLVPNHHEYVNQYAGPKDGKFRFDPSKFPELLRK